jgi:hypothetical protein
MNELAPVAVGLPRCEAKKDRALEATKIQSKPAEQVALELTTVKGSGGEVDGEVRGLAGLVGSWPCAAGRVAAAEVQGRGARCIRVPPVNEGPPACVGLGYSLPKEEQVKACLQLGPRHDWVPLSRH